MSYDFTSESLDEKKARAADIVRLLKVRYPQDPGTALHYQTPLQLLVATILSAQCTDARVNLVTPGLFKKYKSVKDFAEAGEDELGEDIKTTGFYRNKAKSVIGMANMLIRDFGGRVPDTMEELVKLPGVGRKTANLMLGIVFGKPGIVTDTHVIRVSLRLGLTANKDPEKIEYDLNALIPPEEWTGFSSRLIRLGREVCTARKPNHAECILKEVCPSAFKI